MLIGVDFGGTQVKAGIVENGDVVRSTSTPTRAGSSADDVLDTIASTVLALSSKPDAVGVAIPGEVNSDGRCWRLPNVPGFEGVHIAEELARACAVRSRSKTTPPPPRSASACTGTVASTRAS